MSEESNIHGGMSYVCWTAHDNWCCGLSNGFRHVVGRPRPSTPIATESLQMDQAMVATSIVQLARRDPLRGLYVRPSLRCPITKHV